MKEENWSLDEALQYVLKQRSCVKPNRGFMKQLETYQGILDARFIHIQNTYALLPQLLYSVSQLFYTRYFY